MILLKHQGRSPQLDPTAYVAPNAVLCGDVRVGPHARIMFGAQVIAESSPVTIGSHCIILENAVIRGTEGHEVTIGNHCLVGPHAHLAGCTVEDNVFIATGAAVFHGAILRNGAEVRVHAVVHLKTIVPEDTTIPINWVAVGDPMRLFPPEKHAEIWEVQKPLNFPGFVYGMDRASQKSLMPDICRTMSQRLGTHMDDVSA